LGEAGQDRSPSVSKLFGLVNLIVEPAKAVPDTMGTLNV